MKKIINYLSLALVFGVIAPIIALIDFPQKAKAFDLSKKLSINHNQEGKGNQSSGPDAPQNCDRP